MDPESQRQWLFALAILFGSILVGYLIRTIAVRRLAAVFRRTQTELDDLVLSAFRRQIPIWFLLGGVAAAARIAPLSERVAQMAERLCAVGLVLSISFAVAGMAAGLLDRYTRRAGAAIATTSLAQNVTRAIILTVGGLLALSNLGISITPLLTALGIGSLAVALALQPTLSNLFAGLHLAITRPIRVGDFVELENGEQGFVLDIGWRASRMRAPANHVIVVPNSRIADMILMNYNLPDPEVALQIPVFVSYKSDLHVVERITCEVAAEVLRTTPGGVPTFEPTVRYDKLGDSAIGFLVTLRVREYADRVLVTHEFLKRLRSRYAQEGIEIPYPQRVLHGTIGTLPAPAAGPGDGGSVP